MSEPLFERLLGISNIAMELDLTGEEALRRVEAIEDPTVDKSFLRGLVSKPGELYRQAASMILENYSSNPILKNRLNASQSIASQLATLTNQRFMLSGDVSPPANYEEQAQNFAELTFVPHLEMGTYETRAHNARRAGFIASAIPLPLIAASAYAWSHLQGPIPQAVTNIAFATGLLLSPTVGVIAYRNSKQTSDRAYILRASYADKVAKNLDYLIDKALEF